MSTETVQVDKGPDRRDSLASCIEDVRTDKKRKATVLTPDNHADDVFEECFDLDAFIKFLDRSFNVSQHHISRLIDIVRDLEIDPGRIRALDLPDSLPNKTLREDVPAFKHFNLSVSKLLLAFVK